VIEARQLRFGYGGIPLFDGIDLSFAPGEMAALIGPNGSGKTTLLKLLSGTLRAASGEVRLAGRPLCDLTARERARLVGVVPQDSSMTYDFTVMETVLMGRTAHLGLLGVEGPGDLAAALEAMARTGTLDYAGRPLTHLSGGERQLVVIARALAQKPRALLLDEPTAFLDIRHRLEIYELLARLNAQEGLTIVTTSHDINLAARYCRRIVLIKGGRVHADGPPARVFDPAILSGVYETPLRVMIDPQTGLPYTMPPPGAAVTGG
jgi:iron complex transport system ATP-binding protein